ncbi:MAG: ABC-F family ATP-binding cassette domain-containing protein, partial [Candidatus Cloacimonetes bacterium]|nr:ABC-F family ATP-binding cassette domain-containing protein [Candidatus Cloacimonadota bacterium]
QKSFADKEICRNSSFGIHEFDKIGLIGINGCGKSTLLKILAQQENPDNGQITIRKAVSVGYLPQIPDLIPDLTVYEQIYFSEHPVFTLLREYHDFLRSPQANDQNQLQNLTNKLDSCNAWDIEIKAKSILTRLGLTDFDAPTQILSGGQRRRLDLARVLLDDHDLLLLDEPTNHLDIDTIEWFQEYLFNYNGAVIFVTHDRYFLDAVCNRILEIESGILRFYEGNYSNYLKRKELEIIDRERKETRRKSQLSKELKWLQRGARARTSKPKNHVERVKELIDKSYLISNAEMDISFQTQRLGKTILELKNISKSYDSLRLFESFNYTFQKLDRIGIIGANGCGKTTLLRILTGEELPDAGNVKVGVNTRFSYFKQEENDFNADLKVIDYIRQQADNIRTADGNLHSSGEMLEKFLFTGKMQQNKLRSLSGGERKRLYLLKSLMFGSNFMILDEPTNDLDIQTLEILEDYLDAFKGCLLVVSHDRFFLDRVTDYLFIFEKDRIIKFPGNYSDYLLVKRYREDEQKDPDFAEEGIGKLTSRTQKLSYKEKREKDELEKAIADLEKTQKQLEKKLVEEASLLSPEDFSNISEDLRITAEKLDNFIDRWLALSESPE